MAGASVPGANGYIDDISGWDFYQDDNDPFDDVDYGHGTGEANDMVSEAHNGAGAPGFAPSSMFLPLRVGDSFVAVESDFAQAVVYAVDWGAAIVSEALGMINGSQVSQAAIDYAYRKGVPIIASAADEESRHHNLPANFEHTIWANSIRDGDGTAVINDFRTRRFDLLNGCTNYGGRAFVAISSTSCSSEATGRAAGLTALLIAHGKNLVDAGLLEPFDPERGIPYSAEEVRQILRLSAEDIDHESNLSLQMDGLLQLFLSGPTDDTLFASSRFSTQSGWDQYTGYGRPDAPRMLEIASGSIPPEADLSGGLRWFDIVDPRGTPHVPIVASAAAARSDGWLSYEVQVGCGVQPRTFRTIATGQSMVAIRRQEVASWQPRKTANACGFRPAKTISDPDAHTVTLRLLVMDRFGAIGEDRRTVAIHSDRSLAFPPRFLGSSGESSPALADVNGDGILDLVFGSGDGAVRALNGKTGNALPGFPVYTDAIPVHSSPAYASGEVPIPREGIVAAVAADDLDGDGGLDIVAASFEGKLYVFDREGRRRDGFPVSTLPRLSRPENRDRFNDADPGIASAPTLADLDGDQTLEIVAGGLDGHLYAWKHDGQLVDGFPVRIADRSRVAIDDETGRATPLQGEGVLPRLTKIVSSPAVGDLDGDGQPEIVVASNEEYGGSVGFGTESNLLQLLLDGVVDLGDDFSIDIAGRLYVVHANGNANREAGQAAPFRAGWPVEVPLLVSQLLPNIATGTPGAPALADIEPGDGLERLTVAIFGSVGPPMLFDADGEPVLGRDANNRPVSLAADFPGGGFPTNLPGSGASKDGPFFGALGSGAFGDLDGDGSPEYVAATSGIHKLIDVAAPGNQQFGDHQITAWKPASGDLVSQASGEAIFPRPMDDLQFLTSPTLADVDGDGRADIVQGSGAYLLRAYRADGSIPAGWPKFTHGWILASPVVGDIDGDGKHEVVALSREGWLFVWNTRAKARTGAVQWQGFAGDRRNSGHLEVGLSLRERSPVR